MDPQWGLGSNRRLERYNRRVGIRPIPSTTHWLRPSPHHWKVLLISTMSTPPSPTDPTTTTSSDNYPLDLFALELLDIVSNPGMIGHIHDAFSDNPVGSMLIRYYQHVSLSITWMVDILDRHYKERNDVFQYAITNMGFHRGIQPVIREYRRKQWESFSPYQRLLSRICTPSDNLSYDPPTDFNDEPPPSDTQSTPILPEPSDTSSSSYATALKEESEPPTTHEDLTQHEGKTLQQMIEEGIGSSQQNPINIDQFNDGPGLLYGNPIDVNNPIDIPNPYALWILPRRSDDLLAKQWEEIDNGRKIHRNQSNLLHGAETSCSQA